VLTNLERKESPFILYQTSFLDQPALGEEFQGPNKVSFVSMDHPLWDHHNCVSRDPHFIDLESLRRCDPRQSAWHNRFEAEGSIDDGI